MAPTLAFDVYGTLIDPLAVSEALGARVGGDLAPAFARLWRDKQLEYSFRRALMRDYRDFPTCTRQALAYADQQLGTRLPASAIDELLAGYRSLPAYPDVGPALQALRSRGWRAFAFSNGHPDDLAALLSYAGLDTLLDGIVSVHDVSSFKPDPAVYRHFLDRSGATARAAWLVSGNPFDILGAHHVGWRTAWVRRDPRTVFDPWGAEPTATVGALGELEAVISDLHI